MRASLAVAIISLLTVSTSFVATYEHNVDEDLSFDPIPSLNNTYDYRGEQAALAELASTRQFEYTQQVLEKRRERFAASRSANRSAPDGKASQEATESPQDESVQSMSYVAQVVAACESGKRRGNGTAVVGTYSPKAENPNSTASGFVQFLDGTWARLSASAGYARAKHAPLSVQYQAFKELYNKRGLRPWLASASCWRPMLNR